MHNNISDLSVWYPFLPRQDAMPWYDTVCRHIKEVHITLPLHVHVDYSSTEQIKLDVTEVLPPDRNSNSARLRVHVYTVPNTVDTSITVQCYDSISDVPVNSTSFAIADVAKIGYFGSVNVLSLHPDCLDIELYREGADMLPLILRDAHGNTAEELRFIDGQNTKVTFENGVIKVKVHGGCGEGLSDYAAEELKRLQDILKTPPPGIRRINGISGVVKLKTFVFIWTTLLAMLETLEGEETECIELTLTGTGCPKEAADGTD